MNLWSDISALTKEEFVAALSQITAPPKPVKEKGRKAKGSGSPRKTKRDTPAARIVALASQHGIQDRDLQTRLVTILIERGYPPADFPNATGKSLEEWLDELMRKVPSAEVVEAGTSLFP